jgi:Ion channel
MLYAVAGLIVITVILWEAFETIVLPRRVSRRWRVTVLVYRITWIPWRTIAKRLRKTRTRETFLGVYGPLSLPCIFTFWALSLIFGFALLYHAAAPADLTHPRFATSLYMSGTTMFTLGLGDIVPHTSAERVLVVLQSGLGFGFLALVLSYLPVIYQVFSRREVTIVLLDAQAGSPPTVAEILRRNSGAGGDAVLERLLHDWERSAADILESHVSYPVVSYFRSQHTNESWLAALTAILDTCAFMITSVDSGASRQARLTFAMCRHTVADMAQVFAMAPRNANADRLPTAELLQLRTVLTQAGVKLRDNELSAPRLAKLREMYEPYLQALSEFLYMELPPWILATEITDNWRTSAWGRISGFAAPDDRETDDHTD